MEIERVPLSFASEDYLQEGWIGLVSLKHDLADMERVPKRMCPYLDSHKAHMALGRVDKAWWDEATKLYRAEIELPHGQWNAYFREQREAGMRGNISVGYRITRLMLAEIGKTYDEDKWDAAWELLEISDVTVPADTSVGESRSSSIRAAMGPGDVLCRSTLGYAIVSESVIKGARAARESKEAEMAKVKEPAERKRGILERMASVFRGEDPDEVADVIEEFLERQEDAEGREQDPQEGKGTRGNRSESTREEDDDDDEERSERMDDDEDHENRGDDDDEEERAERGERYMTRAEWRRMERQERKDSRERQKSKRYGNSHIIPIPVDTLERDGEEGLKVGNLIRVQMNRSAFSRQASRELEWMERSEYRSEHMDTLALIPFEFLSRYVPMRRESNQKRQKELLQTPHERVRAAITTGDNVGYGTIAVNVDVDNSQAWLYDRAPILEKLTVMSGISGEWKHFWGDNDAADRPNPLETAEGGTVTESSPKLRNVSRLPITITDVFPISSALLASATANIESIAVNGAENLVREKAIRNVLSGPYTGAMHATVANAIQAGLINSGIGVTNYGANANAFNRDDIVGAEQALRAQNPDGEGLVWIVSTGFEELARNERIGGNEAVRFVAERSAPNLFEGIMNPNPGGMGLPYVSTTHLGKRVGNTNEVNPAFLIFGSQAIVMIWGVGIELIPFNDPRQAAMIYGFRMHLNFTFINPFNGRGLRQGA